MLFCESSKADCTGTSTSFFFVNDTATTEIYTLSLHDALPICLGHYLTEAGLPIALGVRADEITLGLIVACSIVPLDRKSTRLNSSHANISYAVFCLKKKNVKRVNTTSAQLPHCDVIDVALALT